MFPEQLVGCLLPAGDDMVAIHLIGHMPQERVDADLAMGEKPVYYMAEGHEDDDKENIDPNETADQGSAGPSTLEREIFGGSSPLSPAVSREVSWRPTTPDPRNLTPQASSEPELQYPVTDDEDDLEDCASDSSREAYVKECRRARQALGKQIRTMAPSWKDEDNTWL